MPQTARQARYHRRMCVGIAAGAMMFTVACSGDSSVFGDVTSSGSAAGGAGSGAASATGSGSAGGNTSAMGSGGNTSAMGSGGAPASGSGGGGAAATGGSGGSVDYVPYGPCDPNGVCPGGQMCVKGSPTDTANVCAPPCTTDSDCPPPMGGTVTPRCYSPGPSCFLWGCGSATCPPGMKCGGVYCVWGL